MSAEAKYSDDAGERKAAKKGDGLPAAAASTLAAPTPAPPAAAPKVASAEGKDDAKDEASALQHVADGFSIASMNMKDGITGEVLWESDDIAGDKDTEARLPSAILECRAVSREINFRSREEIRNFRLEQRVLFHGNCIEQWNFAFGFVIPGSTNSWQQVIEAADEMMPAEVLSGNLVIETSFFDEDNFIAMNKVRIFYE